MSEEAIVWASGQKAPDAASKAVLMRLAAYADAHGVAWAAVPTIAEELQVAERTVQRALRKLEAEGCAMIAPTGRYHHRNVPFYQLDMARIGEIALAKAARRAAARAARTPANGDTVSGLNGDTVSGVAPRTVTPTTANGDTSSPEMKFIPRASSEAPKTGGRAQAREGGDPFEVVVAAWAAKAPGRVSPKLAGPAWDTVAEVHGGERLEAAAARYLAEDPDVKRGRVMSLHRWLADGFCEAWLAWAPSRTAPERTPFAGPEAVLALVADELGVARAVLLLTECGWREADRTILTPTGAMATRLTREIGVFRLNQIDLRFERQPVGS